MGEYGVADLTRLLHLHVPDVSLAHLVTEGQQTLRLVHRKSHEPDFTVLEADLVDDAHFVLGYFAVALLGLGVHRAGLPADNGVLARF